MTFALAMVEHPHVWKRAQAEIDTVVSRDRFPDFDDRSSFPYVDAITREVLRWRPVLPLGASWDRVLLPSELFLRKYCQGGAHAVTQSDIYEGYYIPKRYALRVHVMFSR